VDIVPTLLEGIGLPLPQELHGRSFWPLLQGQSYRANDYIFAEKTFHTAYEPMRGVRSKTHKLIVNFEVDTKVSVPDDIRQGLIYPLMIDDLIGQRDIIELYDLTNDPGEVCNLARDPELAGVEADLKHELLTWMRETDDPLLSGPVASPYYDKTHQSLLTGR
jgi:arylsulfatase A-like enzyme